MAYDPFSTYTSSWAGGAGGASGGGGEFGDWLGLGHPSNVWSDPFYGVKTQMFGSDPVINALNSGLVDKMRSAAAPGLAQGGGLALGFLPGASISQIPTVAVVESPTVAESAAVASRFPSLLSSRLLWLLAAVVVISILGGTLGSQSESGRTGRQNRKTRTASQKRKNAR